MKAETTVTSIRIPKKLLLRIKQEAIRRSKSELRTVTVSELILATVRRKYAEPKK